MSAVSSCLSRATQYFFGTFDPFLRVGLLMCSFKANLIKKHVVEHNYDIVALTETWLTQDDQADINVLTASGYSLCHLPRANKRGGGVGVLFKSTLSKISETPLTTDTFEGLSVTLQCRRPNIAFVYM